MKQTVVQEKKGDLSQNFSADLIAWQKIHGRHTLPWQNTNDAYRIWLSEIMLQQTQVAAVIPYYLRFLQRFPDVTTLAEAPTEDVMAHWSGLGYYSRARNLHRCAREIVTLYSGVFPDVPALLAELPGIGRSTAGAIAAFSYGTRAAIMDGNVKRVFARVFGINTYPGERKTEQYLWQLAESLLPPTSLQAEMRAYTQGLMDLGATLCTRQKPACERCPLADRCTARATGRVAELPIRKPKKATPRKYVVMLVVVDQHQVLLTRRPEHGIWGGLLSLPELDGFTATAHDFADSVDSLVTIQELIRQSLDRFGELVSCIKLRPFSHGFTHFKLHVTPYRVSLAQRREMLGESDQVWVDVAQLDAVPLPAPVRKLLREFFTANDLFAA